MSDQVEFVDDAGNKAFALYESFPLNGGPVIPCLVIQHEDGRPPVRLPADSDEAKVVLASRPEFAELDAPAAPSATPAAVAHAEATGVDLTTVEGSGVDGTILKSDVAAAAEQPAEQPEQAS